MISPVALTCTEIFELLNILVFLFLCILTARSRCTGTEADATRCTSKQLWRILTRLFKWISTPPPPPYEPLEIIRTGATERAIKKMAILRTHSAPPITVISRQMLLLCKKWLPSPLNFFCLLSTVVTMPPPPPPPVIRTERNKSWCRHTPACVRDDRRCDDLVSEGGSGGGAAAPLRPRKK